MLVNGAYWADDYHCDDDVGGHLQVSLGRVVGWKVCVVGQVDGGWY